MNDTRGEIVRLGEEFIRTKGYNAFSYADIAKVIKIKKATIHYYFPSKSDLGVEVIKKTAQLFRETIKGWENLPYEVQLINWVAIYDDSMKHNWVCITGSLAPVFDTLPKEIQTELKSFVNSIFEWVENLLAKGKDTGAFKFSEPVKTKAFLVQSSLLASLLVNKVMKRDSYQIIREGVLMI